MTRLKKLAIFVGFLAAGLITMLALRGGQPSPSVAFTGWTNIGGVRHATFRFPPVLRTDRKPFIYRTYSRIRLEFVWAQSDGRETRGAHQEVVGGPQRLATDIAIPVPSEAVTFNITAAELWLVRRWDNISLPWQPPSSHWTLAAPEVTTPAKTG